MRIDNITDVFFDLDHTLWDFDKNSALTFSKIFKINDVTINIEQFLYQYKTINLKYWKLYRDEKIDKELLRFGRLNDTFLALNYAIGSDTIIKLSQDYITYLTDNNFLIENTISILDYLSNNYKLHILSNGFEEVQYQKLKKSNILHYFQTLTNGETIGIKKPNPEIFNYAIKNASTSAKRSIMIGDGYEADILGAINVGMDVVYFDVQNTPLNMNITQINKLLDLKNYL